MRFGLISQEVERAKTTLKNVSPFFFFPFFFFFSNKAQCLVILVSPQLGAAPRVVGSVNGKKKPHKYWLEQAAMTLLTLQTISSFSAKQLPNNNEYF